MALKNVFTTVWRQKGTTTDYVLDAELVKKSDYAPKSCRLPVYTEPHELLFHDSEWADDGESYVIIEKKYLTAPK